MTFADHFSLAAEGYARYRPGYPDELFRWLADQAPDRALALDCGTGSGQAAVPLSTYFKRVLATDASPAQLRQAARHRAVYYVAASAERSPVADASVSLVTVAQAFHWLDHAAMFRELARCLVPGGLFAVWTYALCHITPEIDPLLREFHDQTVGPWWPSERRLVERGYADLDFPLQPVETPVIPMTADWELERLMGYIETWSAVRRYRQQTGDDPLPGLRGRLLPLWGDPSTTRLIRWPLFLRVGRKPSEGGRWPSVPG